MVSYNNARKKLPVIILFLCIIALVISCNNIFEKNPEEKGIIYSDTFKLSAVLPDSCLFFSFSISNDSVFFLYKSNISDSVYVLYYTGNGFERAKTLCSRNQTIAHYLDEMGMHISKTEWISPDSVLLFFLPHCGGSNVILAIDLLRDSVFFEYSFIDTISPTNKNLPPFFFARESNFYDHQRNFLYSQIRLTYIVYEKANFQYDSLKDKFLAYVSPIRNETKICNIATPVFSGIDYQNKLYLHDASFILLNSHDGGIIIANYISPEIFIFYPETGSFINKNINDDVYTAPKGLEKTRNSEGCLTENGMDELFKILAETFMYKDFVYDEYNTCYYRFFSMEQKLDGDSIPRGVIRYSDGFTIIDTNFQMVKNVWLSEHEKTSLPGGYIIPTPLGLKRFHYNKKEHEIVVININTI